jgi:hypothetical protein
MNRTRSLVAGLSLLLVLAGCSKDTKVVNAVGSYAPVITGVSIDREPAVRGQDNLISVVVTNINGIDLAYHWKADGGVLRDSTAQSVTWDAPDTIGAYTIYVSVTGTDENGVPYFRERSFPIYVDNLFVRWTSGETVKFDVAPPLTQAPGPGRPLVYAELENPSTGESRIVALDSKMATPDPLTDAFFAASGPSIRADGTQVAFAGRPLRTDPGNSIYVIPATGAGPDTTAAFPVMLYRSNFNSIQANPRFARFPDNLLLFNSDQNTLGSPKLFLSDVNNLGNAPTALITGDIGNTYWMPTWSPSGDQVLCESYRFFSTARRHRGVFRAVTTPPFQSSGTQWLPDSAATECDWSPPDGQYVAFAKRNVSSDPLRTERDIWIIRADTNDPARAVRVTSGPADDSHPRFSHDGSTIYFISNRADRYGLNGLFGTERRGSNIWSVSEFDLPQ